MKAHLLTYCVFALGLLGCDNIKARMLAQDGVKAYHAGKIDEAAKLFGEAAVLAPNNSSIQINLGFANLGRYQADPASKSGAKAAKTAIKAFQHYLTLRPGEERAKSYLVQTFVDANQYDAAKAYFAPAVDKPRPDPEALATLGIIASKCGKFDEARTWYSRRIQTEPRNADARLALGVLIWERLHTHIEITGEDRTKLADEGIAELKESIKLKPDSPNAYSYTTMLLSERALAATNVEQKRKDLEAAQKYFKQASARH